MGEEDAEDCEGGKTEEQSVAVEGGWEGEAGTYRGEETMMREDRRRLDPEGRGHVRRGGYGGCVGGQV